MRFRQVVRGVLALCMFTALLVVGPSVQPAGACSGELTDPDCLVGMLPDCEDLIGNCEPPSVDPTFCPARIETPVWSGGVFVAWNIRVYCAGSIAPGDSVPTDYAWNVVVREEPGGIVANPGGASQVVFTTTFTSETVAEGTHGCNLTPGVLTWARASGWATNRFGQGTNTSGAEVLCN